MSKQRTIRTLAIGGAAAAALALVATTPANAAIQVPEPDTFTSAFTVNATPGEVINPAGESAPGEEGATGVFNFRINSELEIICYDITLTGVTGEYQSAANTATHIHEAAAGASGPPRIAFPDPGPITDGTRTSVGCLQGPFTTGIPVNNVEGTDTGDGFTLAQIEANPAGFTGDSHTVNFVPGVVRGQLVEVDLPAEPEPTPEPSTEAPSPEPTEESAAPAPAPGNEDDDADGTDALAETGVDPAEIAGFAFGGLAIAAGAGLLIARRRAQRV